MTTLVRVAVRWLVGVGNSWVARGGVHPEATRKDYGVLVAMPLGHSRVPPR